MVVEDIGSETPIASFYEEYRPRPQTCRAAGGASQIFNVRLADSADSRGQASVLLRRMYAWRGYRSLDAGPTGADATDAADEITLYAETGGELVGTMSLCLDRAGRLPADENFSDRLAILRHRGRRLCEPSRLAIDAGMSKRVLAAMIHVSWVYARRLHGFTDYVIEVNPRHVAFYQHMLGFTHFGGERPCSRVGALAVLLRLPLDQMGAHIMQARAGAAGAGRSFYPHFFGAREEAAIGERLAAQCSQGCRGEPA